ncbi:MAG: HU family DNA-binding protein [Thermodesulfobacteriota bacterium]|nr:HU family DNA-binding protein [Thermodesulfobacteriota bacterium]
MNKSKLIDEMSVRMAIHPKTAESAVNTILNAMTDAMGEDRRVEIRGFGSFVIRKYKAYVGRNPKSGKKIQVDTKSLPFFKAGKDMRERVNSK